MERRVTAILMADMVGYSRLMERDETGTIARQKVHRAELIDPALAAHGGRIVKTTGDGLLVEFPSIVEAVESAVGVQRAVADREADLPEGQRIRYRMGIHLGDVVHEDGDLHGDGVNLAARLEQMADPGGICLSGSAFDQLRTTIDVGYEDLGDVQVKNIARPIRAWRVLLDSDQAGQLIAAPARSRGSFVPVTAAALVLLALAAGAFWWTQRPDITPADPAKFAFELPDKPSIAILAFDNLSGDEQNDYIGDALSENIIATLATMSRMFVISRNSSFHYKGKATPVQTIAEELGVRFVLEGSFQQSGDTIRVTAQLIDALDGQHLWARTYDRALSTSDLFAIQDEITHDIALTLEAELSSGDIVRSTFEDTGDMETLALVSQAIKHYRLFTPQNNQKSQDLLLKVLERRPDSTSALVNLAWTYWYKVPFGRSTDPAADFARARDYANRALEIDGDDFHAIIVLAWVDMYTLDYDSALANAERALSLGPGDGTLTTLAGWVYSVAGYPERGVELLQRGMRMEPYSPDWVPFSLANSLMMASRYDDAKAILEIHVERANPTVAGWSLHLLAAIAVWQDDDELARQYVTRSVQQSSGVSIAGIRQGNYQLKDKDYLNRYLNALRLAGMPEHPPPKPESGD